MSVENIMESHLILDGLPSGITRGDKVSKYSKLLSKKIAESVRCEENRFEITYFYNDKDEVDGAFVEFFYRKDAREALVALNGMKTGKSQLKAFKWEELAKTKMLSDKYVPPEISEDVASETDLTNNMMTDPHARPQFLLKFEENGPEDVVIHWNWLDWRPGSKTVEIYRKPSAKRDDIISSWTEIDRMRKKKKGVGSGPSAASGGGGGQKTIVRQMPMWSPFGTYLVTQHANGIKLWAGRAMRLLLEIEEPDIINLEISPNENYLVVKTLTDVSMWSIRYAKRLRSLKSAVVDDDAWPIVKFNSDDTLCSVVVKDLGLMIFDSAEMSRLSGPDGKVKGATLADGTLILSEWSPRHPDQIVLVFYEGQTTGYRVEIVNLIIEHVEREGKRIAAQVRFESLLRRNFLNAEGPFNPSDPKHKLPANEREREEKVKELRQKYLEYRFAVLWHSEGKYLAAKMAVASSKMNIEYSLFHVSHTRVSAEQLTIEGDAIRFNWNPSEPYFAIIVNKGTRHADGGANGPGGPAFGSGTLSATKDEQIRHLQIYSLKGPKGAVKIYGKPTKGTRLLWAPKYSHLACVDFTGPFIELLGVDAKNPTVVNNYGRVEHPYVNNAEWDPSGRYFITWTGFEAQGDLSRSENNRYQIFDMNNSKVFDLSFKNKLYNVIFRPTAPLALEEKEVADIKKLLPEYIERTIKTEEEKKARKEAEGRSREEKLSKEFINLMNDIVKVHVDGNFFKIRKEAWHSSDSYKMLRSKYPWYKG